MILEYNMNDLGRTSQVSKTDFCGIANLVHNKVEEDIVENANNRLPCRLSSSAQDRRQQQRDCRRAVAVPPLLVQWLFPLLFGKMCLP